MDQLVERINQLAHKEKEEGLTDAEKEEQKELRQKYLKAFRESFKSEVSSLKIVDKEGNDVTPSKIKELKKENNKSEENKGDE